MTAPLAKAIDLSVKAGAERAGGGVWGKGGLHGRRIETRGLPTSWSDVGVEIHFPTN